MITVPRQATTEQVLTSALRAFHITKDPSTLRSIQFLDPVLLIRKLTRSIRFTLFLYEDRDLGVFLDLGEWLREAHLFRNKLRIAFRQ